MPDFKPKAKECEDHLEDSIYWIEKTKYCSDCGKEIKTITDENKIKRTHDIGA